MKILKDLSQNQVHLKLLSFNHCTFNNLNVIRTLKIVELVQAHK